MGALRVEPARVGSWAGRSAGAVWRLYDAQLTVYAALLVGIGLMMAYTNSLVGSGSALESGSTFTRGLLWAAIGIVAFAATTAFDYRWLRTFAWPLYGLNLALLLVTLAIGDGVGGSQRWITVGPFSIQFSELAKVIMVGVLANYLAARHDRLDSLAVILGACPDRAALGPRADAARPRDIARVRGDPRRDALHERRQPALAGAARRGGHGRDALRLGEHPA